MAKEAFVGGSVTDKVGNSTGSWRRSTGIGGVQVEGSYFDTGKVGRG